MSNEKLQPGTDGPEKDLVLLTRAWDIMSRDKTSNGAQAGGKQVTRDGTSGRCPEGTALGDELCGRLEMRRELFRALASVSAVPGTAERVRHMPAETRPLQAVADGARPRPRRPAHAWPVPAGSRRAPAYRGPPGFCARVHVEASTTAGVPTAPGGHTVH